MNKPEEALARLQKKYQETLPDRLHVISELWENLKQVNWSEKTLSRLYSQVHQLAGNARTFGYDALSQQASELEMILLPMVESGLLPSAHERNAIDRRIRNLRAAGEQAPEPAEFSLPPVDDKLHGLVFVVDDDPVSLSYFEVVLEDMGCQVRTFQTLKALYTALEDNLPDLVILDVVLTEGKTAGIDAIEKVRALAGDSLPVVVVSARTDFVAKLKAVRAGANGFLVKPVQNVGILRNLIQENIRSNHALGKSVLVVDDDEFLATNLVEVLNASGYRAAATFNPAEIFKALDAHKPDVIVMDYHMPHCSGLELAEMLRQDERYMMIPIVFLSTEKHPDLQKKAVSLTGNAWLQKPVDHAQLLKELSSALDKARRVRLQISQVSRFQAGRKLVNRQWFFTELESLIAHARSGARSHYLAYVLVDDFPALKHQIGWVGQAEFDDYFGQWLADVAGEGNYVCEMDTGTYAVLTEPYTLMEAERYFDHLVSAARDKQFVIVHEPVSPTISIGYYRITPQTTGMEWALEQVERAATAAEEEGGDRAVSWSRQVMQDEGNVPSSVEEAIIDQAIDSKAFRLVFQPIVNLDTGEKYFEALVRIRSGDKLLPPARFMPQIEKREMYFELDRWVFEHAVQTLVEHGSQASRDLSLFVKISPVDRDLKRYIPYMTNVYRNAGVRGNQKLYLELSESWAEPNKSRLKSSIRLIRDMGCGFVLDHVGQGEHSLSLMNELSPDFVRLDMGLVSRLGKKDVSARETIAVLVSGARNANVKVIAGSVEDASTFALLWELGIRYYQGYFIQEPEVALNFEPVDLA